MQKSNYKINAKKDQLNKLVSAENIKYNKEKRNIQSHEETVKEQVEQYFKELKIKLEHNHETVLSTVKSDLNAISLFTKQKVGKINEFQDCIDLSNASEFFKEVKKMEKFTETQEPRTRPSYTSSPKFVPGNLNQSHIGSLQDDGNLSAEINISLVINNEYQTELESIAFRRIEPHAMSEIQVGIYVITLEIGPPSCRFKYKKISWETMLVKAFHPDNYAMSSQTPD
ncbi:MYH9s [Mytilus edulis]|uniref:MYH9s n=1 Tax=Mytilus edulis TaxID=6550 RepID=A0A8S3VEF3_MYTED|nr:MYH9s [Mytilus edulis]